MKSRWTEMLGSSIRIIAVVVIATALYAQSSQQVPQIWNESDLNEWATPLAQLDVRPAHFSPAEYYTVTADNLKTYPVYPPDREPQGYWDWLQSQKPEPLVDAAALTTLQDWIKAGERAFREIDFVLARTNDPDLIAKARDSKSFESAFTLPDGSVLDPRWVVTEQGLMLTVSDCASCHMRVTDESTIAFGGPLTGWPSHLSFPAQLAFGCTTGEALSFSKKLTHPSLDLNCL